MVIEDACQSLGSTVNGKGAGAWGLTGCFSFYPFKILGGYGDGGAITTNDDEVAAFARRMRFNGEDRETGEYHGHGFTCLLDNLQAAFLDVKLKRMPEWIAVRKGIAQRYRDALSGIGDLLLPHPACRRLPRRPLSRRMPARRSRSRRRCHPSPLPRPCRGFAASDPASGRWDRRGC